MMKKKEHFFFACVLFPIMDSQCVVFSLSLYLCRREMFVWQTNASILLTPLEDRLKSKRTRTITMKSLRNLLYLVHRTNVLDSSQIKREWGGERERRRRKKSYACIFLTIMPLIAFERQCRCVCERDPLPWQEAVTRSVAANETAIKCACSHFRRQSSRMHTYLVLM
jgi:hypothetical protein